MKSAALQIGVGIAVLFFIATAVPVHALVIDSIDAFAWGENIGWLNWGTTEGAVNVPVTSGPLTGYVWGENVGWISLNCSNTASCGTVNYGVTRAAGELSGYGWGENVGWVSFSCLNTASCAVAEYRVFVNQTTGVFTGFAWGENVGWISTNCSNTASCGTTSYLVRTETPPVVDDGGGGGGGGGFLITPTPVAGSAPNLAVSKMPSATSVHAGDPITYSVTVRNYGSATATGVTVSDTIDPNTTLSWVVPAPSTRNGGTFTYNVGTLAPGASFNSTSQVQVRASTRDGTTIANTVRVTADNFPPIFSTSETLVVPAGVGVPAQSPVSTPPGVPTVSVTPTATPTTTPGQVTPPAGPPTQTPSASGFVKFVDLLSSWLDDFLAWFFGLIGTSTGEFCNANGVLRVACGASCFLLWLLLLLLLVAIIRAIRKWMKGKTPPRP